MTTPGVSHPSPTTEEDFRRVLDGRAWRAGRVAELDWACRAAASTLDLIKLDMRLLQGRTTAEAAHLVNTVWAQAERTDAVVIAEGIETIKHAREAAAAGATIGQGFLFG